MLLSSCNEINHIRCFTFCFKKEKPRELVSGQIGADGGGGDLGEAGATLKEDEPMQYPVAQPLIAVQRPFWRNARCKRRRKEE
ncbi:hypothetical protein CDAR_186451 [Caerostris darwini]|uniref:Uncharacterized protein n=1 Tax=Caerostris darwini TaxID=1538125 RepID=A0AAV4SRT3_9ARAC|nr:hypothetical protein CDAR_186451 [Caerostris darwini]